MTCRADGPRVPPSEKDILADPSLLLVLVFGYQQLSTWSGDGGTFSTFSLVLIRRRGI